LYKDKKILVTGGTGMIGSHLIELLLNEGAKIRTIIHKRQLPVEINENDIEVMRGDLVEKEFSEKAVKDVDYVFHLAAYTGGLGRTSIEPATTLTPNLIMDGNILNSAKNEKVEKFLYASCSCVYPNIEKDLNEEDAWTGNPPSVHASYSWSKRMGELQAISHQKEFGMNIAIVRPSNSYGPRDSVNPETAHALGALMSKAIKKMDPFVIWGDGTPIREYIYANDAARGMIIAMEKYCNADPINLASGEFHSIENLAKKIINIVGYNPKIVFDKTKPSGQKRRVLSNIKAEKEFGFKSETLLEEGLAKTLNWYQKKLKLEKK
jgi:GDP-L-fucose synthase